MDARSKLEQRVVAAAADALASGRAVSPIDVLVGIRWLPPHLVDDWRRGRVDYLEEFISAAPDRRLDVLLFLREWAERQGLRQSEATYVSGTRDRRPLRFTADGEPTVELAYRTHWISTELSNAARERLQDRQSRPPELVVISPLSEFTCGGCGGSGGFSSWRAKGRAA